jgi:hypothetical protein
MTTTKTTITGTITKISYRNHDSGWSIFGIDSYPLPITGCLAEMCDTGTTVECTGVEDTGKYGRQLKCESIVPEAPDVSDHAGVVRLLQRLPGIGPVKALGAVVPIRKA